MTRTSKSTATRQSGTLLLELAIGLMIFVIGLLGYLGTYFSSAKNTEVFSDMDAARVSLDNSVEMLMQTQFDQIYTLYNGKTLDAKSLTVVTSSTNPTIKIDCYVDETAIPAVFGPLVDLNGDLYDQTADASGDYKVLPIRFTAQYVGPNGPETLEAHCVLDANGTQKVTTLPPPK